MRKMLLVTLLIMQFVLLSERIVTVHTDWADSVRNMPQKNKAELEAPLFSKLFPPQFDKSVVGAVLHVNEYLTKYSQLGLYEGIGNKYGEFRSRRDLMYFYRININKLDEFEKQCDLDPFGISVFPSGVLAYNNWYDIQPLFTQLIVTCTFVESKVSEQIKVRDLDDYNKWNTKNVYLYKFKVDKWHKGKFLFKDTPEYIYVKGDSFIETKKSVQQVNEAMGEYVPFTIMKNDKMLLFLREDIEDIYSHSVDKYFVTNSEYKIIGDKLYGSYSPYTKMLHEFSKSYIDYIDYIEKLEKINDTPNFYNRSYK